MTCPNATSPIDITNNYDSICELKCEYSFNYPLTTLNLTNKGSYIYMTTENTNTPPVTYNSNKYNVKEIRLYRNSLHTYSGKKSDAELVIVHNNNAGSGNLLVCVPIVIGSSNAETSSFFDFLMNQMSATANSQGKQTSLTNSNFSLDKIVPKKPFFSYNGTLPYSPCNGSYEYIVFNKNNAITMSDKAFKIFSTMISENPYTTQQNKNGLFFNKSGPILKTGTSNDEIYIECLPTGSSGEILIKNETLNNSTMNAILHNHLLKELFNSSLFKTIFGVIIILSLIYGVHFLLSILSNPNKTGGGIGNNVSVSITKNAQGGGHGYKSVFNHK